MGNVSYGLLKEERGGATKPDAERILAETKIGRIIYDTINANKQVQVLVDKKNKKYKAVKLDWLPGQKEKWKTAMKACEEPKVTGNPYSDSFKGKNKDIWKYKDAPGVGITELFKSPEFGSGSGSGGGAEKTKLTESLQCFYLSYLYNGKKIKRFEECANSSSQGEDLNKNGNTTINPISKKELSPYARFCDTTMSLNECWKDGPPEWRMLEKKIKGEDSTYRNQANNNYVKTALGIYNWDITQRASFYASTKKVYFHRGSKFMNAVYKQKAKCIAHDKKNMNKGGKRIAPSSYSNDKWNPGDIWISTLSKTSDPIPDKVYHGGVKGVDSCDWGALRNAVFNAADQAVTLGISLKKIAGATAKVTAYNTQKRSQNKKGTIEWQGFNFGQKGDFFSSVDMYVYFTGNKEMQFRPTGTTKSWQGEIKGGAASGGKLGGGPANYYVEKYFGRSIGSSTELNEWNETKWTGQWSQLHNLYQDFYTVQYKLGTDKYLTDFWKFKDGPAKWKPINTGTYGQSNTLITNLKQFKAKIMAEYPNAKKRESFCFGKLMSLLYLDAIYRKVKTGTSYGGTDEGFCEDSWRYAQSNIKYSSYFIKVM